MVDGQEFGGGLLISAFGQQAAAWFTADAGQVARWLPSPHLHPVRWFDGRALLMVDAGDWVTTIGALPPVRFAAINVAAMVTCGRSRGVPVLPLAALLPLVGGVMDRRYRSGTCYLDSLVTNRAAAEINRALFGAPGSVASVREDRAAGRLRFTATDRTGADILSLDVAAAGRAKPSHQAVSTCVVADTHLIRLPERISGQQTMHLGPRSARLRLGRHPLAEQLRGLGLSTRPLLAFAMTAGTVTIDHGAERLGPADHPPAAPTAPTPIAAPMVIGHADGRVETVDQLLDPLPFDAAGTFEPHTRA